LKKQSTSDEALKALIEYIKELWSLSEDELQRRIDERVIYCKHAPRKTPFGGCIGCKYEQEARKFVVNGICYYCPHFEPEDGWEEKIKKNREEKIIQNFVQTMLDV